MVDWACVAEGVSFKFELFVGVISGFHTSLMHITDYINVPLFSFDLIDKQSLVEVGDCSHSNQCYELALHCNFFPHPSQPNLLSSHVQSGSISTSWR